MEVELVEVNVETLKDTLNNGNIDDADLIRSFKELSSFDRMQVFREVSSKIRQTILPLLSASEKGVVLEELKDDEAVELFSKFDSSVRLNMLYELPKGVVDKLMPCLTESELLAIEYHLSFPEDSVGRLMQPLSRLLLVSAGADISTILPGYLESVQKRDKLTEFLFVVSEERKVIGLVRAQKLLEGSLKESSKVESILEEPLTVLDVADDVKATRPLLKEKRQSVIPVLQNGSLCGAVDIYQAVTVYQQEVNRQIQTSSSLQPLEMSYSKAKLLLMFKKRLPWLLLLLVVNVGSSGVISAFEDTLAENIALAYFIPLLIDCGGNIGSQSASLLIASLAAKDITVSHWKTVVLRELFVGLVIGIALGCLAWVLGFILGGVAIAFVVAITTVLISLVANIVGTALPFLATLVKVDPAAASSPLVTTVMDISGLCIYFGIAILILGLF